MLEDYKRLGQILIDKGVITETQLSSALSEQSSTGQFLGEILVIQGAASEEEIARTLSTQMGFAFVDLDTVTVEPDAIRLVSEDMCRKNTAVPLYILRDTLTIAMGNPLDVIAVDELREKTGLRIKPVFGSFSKIRKAIDAGYHKQDRPGDEGKTDEKYGTVYLGQGGAEASAEPGSLEKAANFAPIIEIVEDIIVKAVAAGASDIHLEPHKNGLNCRFRVDGILRLLSTINAGEQAGVVSRIKIMSNLDIAEKRLPQDGRVRMNISGREIDLRVSTFPTIYGESVVLRVLDHSTGILKIAQLGLSGDLQKAFRQLVKKPYGIVLVTGPTGSGKTSTLYAALNEINSEEKNIITLEDPVEYEIPKIRQSQVNVKAGLTFASGLRSIVRQDPDVIMIGEIRDKETADIAIHAALTGHLVFSTLHTNDAPSAAARLIDMGVEPFLVSSSVIGILAQRLVRILCPSCEKKYYPSEDLIKQLGLSDVKRKTAFYKEIGCRECNERGYSGRIGIFELLLPNEELRSAIAQKSSALIMRDIALRSGMKPLRDSGFEKAAAGITSVSEVLRVTEEI